jgi:hypothetical protein
MNLSPEALAKLGLAADATDEQVSAAIVASDLGPGEEETEDGEGEEDEEGEGEEGGEEGESEAAQVPEGMTVVDSALLQELQEGVAAARRIEEREATADRIRTVDAAIKAGKITPASRDTWITHLSGPDAADKRAWLEKAAPVIPIAERGYAGDGDNEAAASAKAYPESWKPRASGRRSTRSLGRVAND